MPLIMGVDSSTQSTKIEVRDADSGQLLSSGNASHPRVSSPRSEQDPGAWWKALVEAVQVASCSEVAAVAVAAQQHGLVVTDSGGVPLRPAKLWNDTESAPQAAALVERIGASAWAAATGSVPVASFTITKLAWLSEHEPEIFARLKRVLLPHDWLTFRMTDHFVTDRGDASGTGYYSPAEGRWRTDLLELIQGDRDWSSVLPRVLGPTDLAGELHKAAADELGVPAGIAVAPGTGDNMAAALGLGLRPGDVVISIGTSGTVYTISERPSADATGTVAGFADATSYFLPLVCTLNAARVTDTVGRLLGASKAEFDELALRGTPGARGMTLVPYFDGERTPNRPDATGTLHGLRTLTSREDVARAAVEGVVCGLLDGLDALREAAGLQGRPGRIFLVGGGSRSSAYRRILADLAGCRVLVPDNKESVAAGACVQAAAALLGKDPHGIAEQWRLDEGQWTEPQPGCDAASIRARYAKCRS